LNDIIEGQRGSVAVGSMEDDDRRLGVDSCFHEEVVYAYAFPEKRCTPSFNAEDSRHFRDGWMIGDYLIVGVVQSFLHQSRDL